jgi:hypothetical protein
MDNEKLMKVLFVLTLLKNKHKDEEKIQSYIDEAISYINDALGI